jgi:hypothetical protein
MKDKELQLEVEVSQTKLERGKSPGERELDRVKVILCCHESDEQ